MKINKDHSAEISRLFAARANPWAPKYEPEFWNDCSETAYEINIKRYEPILAKLNAAFNISIDRPSVLGRVLRTYSDDNLRLVTDRSEIEIKAMRKNFTHFLNTTFLSTNCYAYALNIRRGFRPGDLLTPGYLGQIGGECSQEMIGKNISTLFDGLAKDGFEFFKGHPNHDRPPAGFYLAALLVHHDKDRPGKLRDFHFVRYDRDGGCSHKMGHSYASRSYVGKTIVDPTTPHAFGAYKYEGSILVPAVMPQHQLCP